MEKVYVYFVGFQFSKPSGFEVGNAEYITAERITELNQIREVEKDLIECPDIAKNHPNTLTLQGLYLLRIEVKENRESRDLSVKLLAS